MIRGMIHTIYETGGQFIHLDSCKERRNGDDKARPQRIVGHLSLVELVWSGGIHVHWCLLFVIFPCRQGTGGSRRDECSGGMIDYVVNLGRGLNIKVKYC